MNPLIFAWKNILYNKVQFFALVCAIAFTVVILYSQTLFLDGLLQTEARLAEKLDADLIVASSNNKFLRSWDQIEPELLPRLYAQEAIMRVSPLYLGLRFFKTREQKQKDSEPLISVIAFPPETSALLMDERSQASLSSLKSPGTVLFDTRSSDIFGHIKVNDQINLSGYPVTVKGFVEFGPGFSEDGLILMSHATYSSVFGSSAISKPRYALIKTKEGTDLSRLQSKLSEQFSQDEIVFYTKQELYEREMAFIKKNAPLGIVFGIGLFIGVVISIIICYSIVSNEIDKNLKQYATLKAMGFSQFFLRRLIIYSSLIIALFGYLLGSFSAFILYLVLKKYTSIFFLWNIHHMIMFLILIACSGTFAGLLAYFKIKRIDPAELF